ncbi:hypothetical protein RclHR1_17280001 [Rhizophagus clarus]|uniref:Uncharacterized protein n=1 Tax=Rhizophagus clarus TaxID=94130 RepID=A0A2Z6QJR5_9GLOM|nr:hypothetical protein RclHR1_17280001 [Rhizophagus clarus]
MKGHLAMKCCKGRVSKDIWLNFLREINNEHESSETLSTSSKKQKISNNQTTLKSFYDNNKIDEVKSNQADKVLEQESQIFACNLIAPVKKAVKDVKFQNTILADVFVELVKIAITVQEIPTLLNDQMNISYLESMAQIHFFLIANAPSELNFINNDISQDEFTAVFNQIAIAIEEGIDLFEKNDSFPVFDERIFDEFDDNKKNNGLQLQNKNGLNLEISELIQLNVKQSDSINENQSNINKSRIEHGDKNFSIKDLL